ncbi:MAG: type II toxin-antitoxin system VapC family toxin [Planctomycetota bacterium]
MARRSTRCQLLLSKAFDRRRPWPSELGWRRIRPRWGWGWQSTLRDFLDDLQVLAVTEDIAQRFGELRARLLAVGGAVPEMDLLIGATALVHNLTMVTHNVQDYFSIPGLAVADWLAP